MCYHTHSSPNESIDCVARCKINLERNVCDNTILPHLITKNRLTELGMRLFVAEIGERLIFACGENIKEKLFKLVYLMTSIR